MTEAATLNAIIPHTAPTDRVARALLIAIRRLALGGMADAHATTIMMGDFGIAYRRPLVFLRVFLSEVSRISERQIAIAPCCCSRMTDGEAALLTAIDRARDHPEQARAALARTTGTLDCLPALSIAQALASALDDIGHPFRLSQTGDRSD